MLGIQGQAEWSYEKKETWQLFNLIRQVHMLAYSKPDHQSEHQADLEVDANACCRNSLAERKLFVEKI